MKFIKTFAGESSSDVNAVFTMGPSKDTLLDSSATTEEKMSWMGMYWGGLGWVFVLIVVVLVVAFFWITFMWKEVADEEKELKDATEGEGEEKEEEKLSFCGRVFFG